MNNVKDRLREIVHDTNNYLNDIIKCAEKAERNDISRDELKKHLKIIKSHAFKIAELLRGLHSVSASSSYESFNLNEMLGELTEAIKVAEGDRLSISVNLSNNLWKLLGNRLKIGRAISNILKNASEAIAESGNIYITTENVFSTSKDENPENLAPGRYVRLEIADNGCGISGNNKERIFELGQTSKEKDGLSGTGLHSAQNAICSEGGFITAEDSTDNGAVFTIFLPAFELPASGNVTRKILVADDDPVLNDLLSEEIRNYGWSVNSAQSGNAVVEQGENFDLLILDQNLPEKSGTECAAFLNDSGKSTPIIIISGDTEDINGKSKNIRSVIKKPFKTEYLIHTIGHLI